MFTLFLFLVGVFILLAYFAVGYCLAPGHSRVTGLVIGGLALLMVLYAFYITAMYLHALVEGAIAV